MKRILFVISALGAGGAEKSLVNLLNLLDYTKYDVDLLLFKKEGAFYNQLPKQVHVLDIPKDLYYLFHSPSYKDGISIRMLENTTRRIAGTVYKNIFYKDKFYPGMQARWNKFYKKGLQTLGNDYDIAVSYMHGEAMYFVAEKVKAKCKITWIHNDYHATKLEPKLDLPYLQQFNQIVTISDECADIFKSCFPNLTMQLKVLPNLTSSDTINSLANSYYPEEYQECKDLHKNIVVSIGRLSEQKGFDVAIKIAAVMKRKNIAFCWFILGQGELKETLLNEIDEYGVKDCIKLIGIRENPYPYLKHADIVAQPSRFEGKSVVLDEAKILCKPIIVANYSTVKDQIIAGKEGIIAELETEKFAEKMTDLLSNVEKQSALSGYLEKHEYGNAVKITQYYELFESEFNE